MSEQQALPMDDPEGAWKGVVDLPDEKWPSSLATIVDVLTAMWEREGKGLDDAIRHAQQAALAIAEHQGGRPVYLPRGDRLRQALRDRHIYLLHRGNNADALAERFGLTLRHIQRIYAEQRAIQIAQRQPRLF